MFILMSVTRDELSISENFCATKQEAVDAMIKDILLMTNYDSLDEIIKASENDEAGFSDDEAWTETKQFGTGQWKIAEVPGVVESADGMPAKIQPSEISSPQRKKAKWENHAQYNDYLWTQCSECGYRTEMYNAVETGRSDAEYVAVKWLYCPKCGSEMSV